MGFRLYHRIPKQTYGSWHCVTKYHLTQTKSSNDFNSVPGSQQQAGRSFPKNLSPEQFESPIDSCVRNLSTEILKPSEAARTVDNTCSHGCASKTTSFDTTHTPSPSRLQRESTLQPNRNRTAAAPYTDLHTPGAGPAKLKN